MTVEPSTGRRLYFQGQERVDVLEDLARGGRTDAELAEKYGRGIDAIARFSSRNRAEIATRRAELQGELSAENAHLWIADKSRMMAAYQDRIEEVLARLDDPDLDDRMRSRFLRDFDMLSHRMIELQGWVPQRVQPVSEAAFSVPTFPTIAQDEHGNWFSVSGASVTGEAVSVDLDHRRDFVLLVGDCCG